jgi:hypothetical protein
VGRLTWAALLTLLAVVVCGCGGAKTAVRLPTTSERAGIAVAVTSAWNYEATFNLQPWVRRLGFRNFRDRHYRPTIVSVRVSRADPKLATAAVAVVDARGQRTPYGAVLVLAHGARSWEVVDVPATVFLHSCVPTLSRDIRDLLCPDPWSILGMRHTGLPASAQVAVIRHRWHTTELPGAVCGATHPIRLHWERGFGGTAIHSAYWPWWAAVGVYASGPIRISDINGDGEDEAYFSVTCDNTGGTGESILSTADVVFSAEENVNGTLVRPLRLLGIITPQQPYSFGTNAPYDARLDVVTRSFNPQRSVIVAPEHWYGSEDPSSCCPSGRATTIWKYARGRLSPIKTVVALPPAQAADTP